LCGDGGESIKGKKNTELEPKVSFVSNQEQKNFKGRLNERIFLKTDKTQNQRPLFFSKSGNRDSLK
jgi:hypothetical protein